jgi:glutathione S-transferase
MPLTLYTAPYSTATLTEAALKALNLDYERVVLGIDAGDTRKPAFRALNPNGRVPVLVHDGEVLWESAAIVMHLGESFGQARDLYPGPGIARAHAMKWIVWGSATLAEAAGRLASSLPPESAGAVQSGSIDFVAMDTDQSGKRAAALADLSFLLGILNQALEDREYLIGNYSLADIHLAGLVGWIASMEAPIANHASVLSWLARCEGQA